MSDRFIIVLLASYVSYTMLIVYVFFHPTYNWTPREVAREHIYDYDTPLLRR